MKEVARPIDSLARWMAQPRSSGLETLWWCPGENSIVALNYLNQKPGAGNRGIPIPPIVPTGVATNTKRPSVDPTASNWTDPRYSLSRLINVVSAQTAAARVGVSTAKEIENHNHRRGSGSTPEQEYARLRARFAE